MYAFFWKLSYQPEFMDTSSLPATFCSRLTWNPSPLNVQPKQPLTWTWMIGRRSFPFVIPNVNRGKLSNLREVTGNLWPIFLYVIFQPVKNPWRFQSHHHRATPTLMPFWRITGLYLRSVQKSTRNGHVRKPRVRRKPSHCQSCIRLHRNPWQSI